MKTRKIIERALRQIRVVAIDIEITDEYAADGLSALNEMMHSWRAQGAEINHADLALDDDFPLPSEHHRAAIVLLAQYLAPEYSEAPPDKLEVDTLWSSLQGAYWADPAAKVDEALRCLPSQGRS